jgi:site-specific DNA recombinase
MPSSIGHGPKRAILYARVSTDEQARSGYSLAQQLEALREHAYREGYEVLEEVSDPGQSGVSLERPGMDHVRDLVATGGVSVVLAQDRDRFAREPAYHYLLRREFEEHGTKIRALNDRGDESPEGELTDGILDQLAKYERAKMVERSRRGKLRKAREGKVVATRKPPYGFRYNEARDGLVVYEPEMVVVEKIFRLAEEGLGTTAIQRRLYNEKVAPCRGQGHLVAAEHQTAGHERRLQASYPPGDFRAGHGRSRRHAGSCLGVRRAVVEPPGPQDTPGFGTRRERGAALL